MLTANFRSRGDHGLKANLRRFERNIIDAHRKDCPVCQQS